MVAPVGRRRRAPRPLRAPEEVSDALEGVGPLRLLVVDVLGEILSHS